MQPGIDLQINHIFRSRLAHEKFCLQVLTHNEENYHLRAKRSQEKYVNSKAAVTTDQKSERAPSHAMIEKIKVCVNNLALEDNHEDVGDLVRLRKSHAVCVLEIRVYVLRTWHTLIIHLSKNAKEIMSDIPNVPQLLSAFAYFLHT